MVLNDNGMESYVFPVSGGGGGSAKPEQTKTVNVTENGTQTVTPDTGYTLSGVTINTNVPSTPTQTKTVEISSNGQTVVTPDSGYTLSSVTVDVDVPAPASKFSQLVDRSITTVTASDLAGATEIGPYSFYNCKSLTSVVVPEGVTSIEAVAFSGCDVLQSVTLPNTLTNIGNSAFTNPSLVSITIPASVTSISSVALRIGSPTNKATITMLGQTPPTIASTTFNPSYLNQIIVPAGCGDTYKAATNWAKFADYIVEATA